MAKLSQGILGPFSGKVGTVVGYTWRGRECLRGYVRHINYPDTALQRSEREWFVSMVRFAARARQALLLGLADQAARHQMTEGNLFVKRNKHCFKMIDGALQADYSAMVLAQGTAAPVAFAAPEFGSDGVLRVDFEKNTQLHRASPEDRVYLYAYCPAAEQGLLTAPTARRTKHLSVALPDSWRGCEVHLWGFVVDREGRPSDSSYIGSNAAVAEIAGKEYTTAEEPILYNTSGRQPDAADGEPRQPEPHLRT